MRASLRNVAKVMTFVLATAGASAADNGPVTNLKLAALFQKSMNDHEDIVFSMDETGSERTKAVISTTSKGNGTLSVSGLVLRTFDIHDDSLVYKDRVLDVALVDLNGDGLSDLVVSGIATHTGENETDPQSDESIVFIYMWDKKSSSFEEVYRKSSFAIRLGK